MIQRIFTIGAYGKTADQFFGKLLDAGIDTFCDIRQRRGVRGAEYAFVNSQRLQTELHTRRIAYVYLPELAPTTEMRSAQYALDRELGVGKRTRQELGEAFKHRYVDQVLSRLDLSALGARLAAARFPVFFCVEASATACHRSLVAERLKRDWNVEVEHL